MNPRPRIEAILCNRFAVKNNLFVDYESTANEILALISEHYVSKEKVKNEIEKLYTPACDAYDQNVKKSDKDSWEIVDESVRTIAILNAISNALIEDRAISNK